MGAIVETYNAIWGAYLTPEEASQASTDQTDKALGENVCYNVDNQWEQEVCMECIRKPNHNHHTGYVNDGCRCPECTETIAEYSRRYRRTPRGKALNRMQVKRRSLVAREKLDKMKMELGCSVCGYRDHPAALEWHHRDKETKSFTLANACSRGWDQILSETEKCDVLCSNCHHVLSFEERMHG